MRFGVAFGAMHPGMFAEAARAVDELGFESLWLPEHLVLPVSMSGSPYAGEDHPPIPPATPVFDVFAFLAYLAGITRRVRLGTHVYNLALRHPFVAPSAMAGRRVLVVDDTWVTGATARSAAACLAGSGVTVPGVLVLGRAVEPGAQRTASGWWQNCRQLAGQGFERCCLEGCRNGGA